MTPDVRSRLRVMRGDITQLSVDAIVNAANASLAGGGGVDGAIHRAAGPELLAACRSLGGCPTGEARITRGFRLPAKHVIHAVGPRYRDGKHGEADQLRSCYQFSLRLAEERGLNSVAFPCIATGVYGYPPDEACAVAVDAVAGWLADHAVPDQVIFCCFTPEDFDLYAKRLDSDPEA